MATSDPRGSTEVESASIRGATAISGALPYDKGSCHLKGLSLGFFEKWQIRMSDDIVELFCGLVL